MRRSLSTVLRVVIFTCAIWPVLRAEDLEADSHRFVLIDTQSGQWVREKTLSSKNFDGIAKASGWSVRKEVLHGGKQNGVDLITIENGAMAFRVIPTRGMSILDVEINDFRIGWESPVKEVVHPQWVNLESRGGIGWLEGFNEWMVRCGLEFAGHPGVDQFTDNTGAEAEMMLTLHGKVGNIPASRVELLIDKAPPHRIRLRGTVHESMLFGPKLKLTTEVSTIPGSTELTISDEVTNIGSDPQEIQLIYHTNFGVPLLSEGANFIAPVQSVQPMNAAATEDIDAPWTYAAPTKGYIEKVYLMKLYADANSETLVCLKNSEGNRAATIRYNVDQLPCFTLWKNLTTIENGYVTGLEPGTSYPFNRSVERPHGRIPVLAADETRQFTLTYEFMNSTQQINESIEEIRKLQNDRPTEILQDPPE
ncbi:aldose 1-epimerase family protein [Thalassoglobus sp. JC818]|uniref:aldose 1-epimerase family protein n=1 Tax=Thalassoglobus sp. JC818 TaxID=3232136 RepID=UPI0034597D20